MLKFSVFGQTLTRRDTIQVVENEYNYLYCAFNFSVDWNGMNISAIFELPPEPVTPPTSQTLEAEATVLEGDEPSGEITTTKKQFVLPIIHGVCIIPWEVVKAPSFNFSLSGFNGRSKITTNSVVIPVEANTDNPIPDPPPSILAYEACLSAVNQFMESVASQFEHIGETKAELYQGVKSTFPDPGEERDVYADVLNHTLSVYNKEQGKYITVGADHLMLETATVMPIPGISSLRNLNVHMLQQTYTKEWWNTNNPILMNGEIGVESDTRKMKIGNGTTPWNELKYSYNNGAVALPRDPEHKDYEYEIGTIWVNVNTWNVYIITYNAENSAHWEPINKGGVQ